MFTIMDVDLYYFYQFLFLVTGLYETYNSFLDRMTKSDKYFWNGNHSKRKFESSM